MNPLKIFKSTAATSLALSAVVLCSAQESHAEDKAAKVLRFAAIPDQDTTAQAERYAPVVSWMSKELGVKVEYVSSSDYGASVDKFATGDVQLAWFGGVSGVQARNEVPNSRALIAGEKDLAFKSYFIAHESTGLTKSDEFPTALKGMTFTFGSSGSTSGCIMPAHFIVENTKINPMKYFGQVGFSGSHDKTAYQVEKGTFKAGAMNFSTYEKLVKEGKIDGNKCRVIWETPTYADYNFTARGDLDAKFGEGFTDKLQKALLECKDAAVLKAFDRDKFVKVENATFEGIANVMKNVKLK